jgi:hypothetical protein
MHPNNIHKYSQLRSLLSRIGLQVFSGPFNGLKYIANAHGSTLGPKLLGSYEIELETEINALISKNPPLIIDVGAAEGYYAVGLAYRLPESKIIAFEASERGRILLGDLARLNQVHHQIEIHGLCDKSTFIEVISNNHISTIIMDIEGGEDELLCEETTVLLKSTSLIVEIHEFIRAGVGARIKQRFSKTHSLLEITASPRRISDVRQLLLRPIVWILRLLGRDYLSERRPPNMSWLILKPLE